MKNTVKGNGTATFNVETRTEMEGCETQNALDSVMDFGRAVLGCGSMPRAWAIAAPL